MPDARKVTTVRLNAEERGKLDELSRDRGGRKRGEVLRALILEEHRRLVEGLTTDHVELVDEHALHELLSVQARDGNVGAMRELRFLLSKPPGDGGGRGNTGTPADDRDTIDPLDALDEVAEARKKRGGRAA